MVDAQILSKVLDTGNIEIITHNGLNSDYFPNYKEEFKFIVNHYKEYDQVPDKETFLAKFPDFNLIKVQEADSYLVETISEQYLYNRMVPIIKKVQDYMTKDEDSRKAIEYLQRELPTLTDSLKLEAKDIVKDADERITELEKRKDGKYFITTGFKELDNALMGWQRGEDLVTLIGRTNEGKCFIKGTKVLMYNGTIKNIEDIKIGDKVQSYNSINNVIGLHKGIDTGYKIIPKRASHPLIVTNNHIITVWHRNTENGSTNGTGTLLDLTIEDFLNKSKSFQKNCLLFRPTVEYSHKTHLIPAYILGLWLGDGTGREPDLTSMDEEVSTEWTKYGKSLGLNIRITKKSSSKASTFSFTKNGTNLKNNPFKQKLREYKLLENKHIPLDYLTGDMEQRLELLAGLIDTDGYYNVRQQMYELCTKSEILANNYCQLLRGLGFKTYCKKILNKKYLKNYYRITFSGPIHLIPCRLGYKKVRVKNYQVKRNPLLTSFTVEKINTEFEYYGFECDGDHRFLLEDNTLVHNSWIVLKFLEEAWKAGYRVGLYSGEMTSIQMGFRFDTIYSNFSNFTLTNGEFDTEAYKQYIHQLKDKNSFFIITPEDMGGECTVSKLEAFIQKYKLDILGVDQYSLMEDEQAKPNQPLRTKYDNISKGLFLLSCKYRIPILAAVQANRNAVLTTNGKKKTEGPRLEHISESDAIAHNSSRVIAMRQNEGNLEFEIVKNRIGGRNGKYLYRWLIDTGKFEYVPTLDNNDHQQVEHIKKQFKDKEDVF